MMNKVDCQPYTHRHVMALQEGSNIFLAPLIRIPVYTCLLVHYELICILAFLSIVVVFLFRFLIFKAELTVLWCL